MKLFFLILFICSSAFAGDYSYKVVEFKKVKNGPITESATMTIECSKDGLTVQESDSLTSDEIEIYLADNTNSKIIAERISSLAKIALDKKAKDITLTVVKDNQSTLDSITIDSSKVK